MPARRHDAGADDFEVIVFGHLGDQRADLGRAHVDADDDAVVAHRKYGRSPKRTSISCGGGFASAPARRGSTRSVRTCWSTLPASSKRARQPSRVGTSRSESGSTRRPSGSTPDAGQQRTPAAPTWPARSRRPGRPASAADHPAAATVGSGARRGSHGCPAHARACWVSASTAFRITPSLIDQIAAVAADPERRGLALDNARYPPCLAARH